MILRSYAKVNLSLDVLGLLPNGYHNVETVMQKTTLFDEIDIDFIEDNTSDNLEIELSSSKYYLPKNEANLAYQAAVLINEIANKKGKLKINIQKRIPVSAGLAGGSGNAAAVLIGLNRIFSLGLDTKKLAELGKKLGTDIPFLVLTQNTRYTCALGYGTGSELKPLPKGIEKDLVIAKPSFGVSTKKVYQGIDSVGIEAHPNTQELIEGIEKEDYEKVLKNMVNVLENYTLKEYPEVKELKEKMLSLGKPLKVLMSGSGPSVLGVYETTDEAREVALELRNIGYEAYWLKAFSNRSKR